MIEHEKRETHSEYSAGTMGMIKGIIERYIYPENEFMHYRSRWQGITGWLTACQAKWLFDSAKNMNPGSTIIEIGSAYGRSTICLGLGLSFAKGGKVFSVDPHTGGKGFREKLTDRDSYSSYVGFRRNIERFGLHARIVPMIKTSEDALKEWKGGEVHFLFIDGWHTYDAVIHDLVGWGEYVVSGGLIALHDYQVEEVRSAIHDGISRMGIGCAALRRLDSELVFFRKP